MQSGFIIKKKKSDNEASQVFNNDIENPATHRPNKWDKISQCEREDKVSPNNIVRIAGSYDMVGVPEATKKVTIA